MLTKKTIQFLKDLKKNNNREWFAANKSRYEEAKTEFENFLDTLIPKLAKFDKSIANLKAKNCVFRIYRDVRFSKDKSPYKTHFGAHITSGGKKSEIHSKAGYYIHVEVGDAMLAGGAYLPPTEWLNAIRQEINYNANDFKKILNSAEFKKYFGKMEGEKLVKAPKGYEPNHPEIELLKHKSFLATHKISEKELLSKDFLSHTVKVFKALEPFDNFLNRAMD